MTEQTEWAPALCDEEGCDERVTIITTDELGELITAGWCTAHTPDRYRRVT
jgi:hypothetical protein